MWSEDLETAAINRDLVSKVVQHGPPRSGNNHLKRCRGYTTSVYHPPLHNRFSCERGPDRSETKAGDIVARCASGMDDLSPT